jgi:hypothetical protein
MSKELMNSFAGKWALITGASSGLGPQISWLRRKSISYWRPRGEDAPARWRRAPLAGQRDQMRALLAVSEQAIYEYAP